MVIQFNVCLILYKAIIFFVHGYVFNKKIVLKVMIIMAKLEYTMAFSKPVNRDIPLTWPDRN